MKKSKAKSTTTGFRDSLGILEAVHGKHHPLWPALLGHALNLEFLRQVESDESYSGEVFKDRDHHSLEDGDREERRVANLYRAAHASDGCISLHNERVWLVGYQWPTQGSAAEKSRRADLVGLTEQGGLVVCEAKVAKGTPPLHALCEGLDYLACLLRSGNFTKIEIGFQRWKQKADRKIPMGFELVQPNRLAKPKLIILAPENYYTGKYSTSIKGREWPDLVRAGISMIPSIDLHFATTDFDSTKLGKPPIKSAS